MKLLHTALRVLIQKPWCPLLLVRLWTYLGDYAYRGKIIAW